MTPIPNALTHFLFFFDFLFLFFFLVGASAAVHRDDPGVQRALGFGPGVTFLCIATFFFLGWRLRRWPGREEVLLWFFLSGFIAVLPERATLTRRQNQQDDENHSGRTGQHADRHAEALLTQNPLVIRVACNVQGQGDPQTASHLKGRRQRDRQAM